jgi:CIC family chloride channel protein
MRADFENALSSTPIAEAQKLFSPARVRQIVLRDPNGTSAGLVSSADLHSIATKTDQPLSTLALQKEEFLLPDASIREIMIAFERSEADVLAVIDRLEHRATVGTVSEANVLRTYGEELERRNQELFFR